MTDMRLFALCTSLNCLLFIHCPVGQFFFCHRFSSNINRLSFSNFHLGYNVLLVLFKMKRKTPLTSPYTCIILLLMGWWMDFFVRCSTSEMCSVRWISIENDHSTLWFIIFNHFSCWTNQWTSHVEKPIRT